MEQNPADLVDLRHVQSFRAGQAVPEWLIVLDPKSPTANRGTFCFATNADLYEKNDRYWLLPRDPLTMQSMLVLIGTQDCAMVAGSKQVSWPIQIVTGHSAE